MINNYWEDIDMPQSILEFHEKTIEDFSIPQFIKDLKCPYCKEELSSSSIREVGMNFNTRNIGDIFVQFCCSKCSKMNTLYYRKQVSSVKDFNKILDGSISPNVEPVLEEDMYKLKYNNLVEKMLVDMRKT